MKLVERITLSGKLIESKRENLPEGVLCRVEYPICNVGVLNANKRLYEMAVWEIVMQEDEFQRKMKERCLFGHAEHPDGSQSNLECTSHVIFETRLDEAANMAYQRMDVLDTPAGRIVDCLLRAECTVGVSTRAEGELEECEDKTFGKYHRVIPESYKYITTDFTADPSTFDMAPVEVIRDVVSEAKTVLASKADEKDKAYATSVLAAIKEGGGVPGRGVTGEEYRDPAIHGPAPGEKLSVIDTIRGQIRNLQATFSEFLREVPNRPQVLVQVSDQLKNTIELLVSGIETPASDEEKMPEQAADMYRENIDLRVKEAISRVEAEKASELLVVEEGRSSQSQMEYKLVSGLLKSTEKENEIQTLVVESSALSLKKKVGQKDALVEKTKTLHEGVLEQLAEAKKVCATTLVDQTTAHENVLAENKEDHKKEIKGLKEEITSKVQQAVIRMYAQTKINQFGKPLHESHQALLVGCSNVAEVDDVFEKIVDSLRSSALHSKTEDTSNIIIERSAPANKKSDEIGSRVETAMESMIG